MNLKLYLIIIFIGCNLYSQELYFDAGVGAGYNILLGDFNAQYDNGLSVNLVTGVAIDEKNGFELELGYQYWVRVVPRGAPPEFLDNYFARFNYKRYLNSDGNYLNYFGGGLSYNNVAFITGVRNVGGPDFIGRVAIVDNSPGIHLFYGVTSFFTDELGGDLVVNYNRLFTENAISFISINATIKYFFNWSKRANLKF